MLQGVDLRHSLHDTLQNQRAEMLFFALVVLDARVVQPLLLGVGRHVQNHILTCKSTTPPSKGRRKG